MAKPQTVLAPSEQRIISRAEILARLQDPALVIVSVVPADSFKAGHIPGSLNLPIAHIRTQARHLLSNFDQEIAVYCTGPT